MWRILTFFLVNIQLICCFCEIAQADGVVIREDDKVVVIQGSGIRISGGSVVVQGRKINLNGRRVVIQGIPGQATMITTKSKSKKISRKSKAPASSVVKTQPNTNQFTVEMVDGSSMVSRMAPMKIVPLDLSYGTIQIPIEQVSFIHQTGSVGQFRVSFNGGDVLTGKLLLTEIKYDTDYGQLTIAREKIKKITVMTVASAPLSTTMKHRKPETIEDLKLEQLKMQYETLQRQISKLKPNHPKHKILRTHRTKIQRQIIALQVQISKIEAAKRLHGTNKKQKKLKNVMIEKLGRPQR